MKESENESNEDAAEKQKESDPSLIEEISSINPEASKNFNKLDVKEENFNLEEEIN